MHILGSVLTPNSQPAGQFMVAFVMEFNPIRYSNLRHVRGPLAHQDASVFCGRVLLRVKPGYQDLLLIQETSLSVENELLPP